MMDIRQLSPYFSVAAQMTPDDVGHAAAQGYQAIMSNRPDREADDQPDTRSIAAAAERAGLTWHYLPVISGNISDQDVEQFHSLIESTTGPVLAFCRTGMRSATLWALAQARQHDVDAILAATQAAGFDLSGSRERLLAAARVGAED